MDMNNRFFSKTSKLLLAIGFMLFTANLFAKENIKSFKPDDQPTTILAKGAGCAAATAQRDLDINNVRTTILNGGDMWWNLSNARYEVPKVQTGQVAKHSLFSGALWIGGVTNNNLRIAAQTYRQSGNDFYPGPLTIGTASITQDKCKAYDRIWKITLSEINDFRTNPNNWFNPSEEINTWPVHVASNVGEADKLAPFFDNDNDGRYDPSAGDYPSFDQNVKENIPDMMMFILYNDKGNIHSESEGIPIGLELHTQAFGYATNDEVNNMTFYRTTIFNRSNEIIDSCVFGEWVDPDLGNYADDYVECDVKRNLGICYNGDDNDEGQLGYGLNPPSVGVTFFEGPRRPDSSEIGLTKFVYYNNDFSPTGNPSRPEHYWGYLNGRWKDGSPITYGGNGKGGSDTASFMFPGDTDPAGRATWNERNSQNTPSDRRFLQTAGSFSLLPGAVNRVTIGVVWARASSGGATGSFNLLKQASDKAFVLFKNNFKLISGPEAPKLEIVELKNKLVFKMVGTESIENFTDSFQGNCGAKTIYKFQGYLIYQVKIPSIPNDFYDTEEAKLIAQFDVTDGNAKIVNAIFDPELEEDVKKIMVDGADKGIQHTFEITKDFFETGTNQTLVNFKNYHYLIVSYAAATNCATDRLQFLPGRKTIGEEALAVYSATPHDPSPRNGGTKLNADYGTGLPITAVEGIGNGGTFLELSEETIDEALRSDSGNVKQRVYKPGAGPIQVKVVDPFKVPGNTQFTVWLREDTAGNYKNAARFDSLSAKRTFWYIRNNNTGEVRKSAKTIESPYEQLFNDWGISVNITQSIIPGDVNNITDQSNGYLNAQIIEANANQKWLDNIIDEDPIFTQLGYSNQFNWIRSGSNGRGSGSESFSNPQIHDFALSGNALDPRRNYSKIIDGTWSPYALASRWRTNSSATLPTFGPAWDAGAGIPGLFGGAPLLGPTGGASADNPLKDLNGVDLVITPDRSKWTRCVVVETGEDYRFNQNNVDKLDARSAPSVDKFGRTVFNGGKNNPNDPEAANYKAENGLGWFPGYAIDVETGERLNIMFGEDSSLPTENGTDMRWNPTSNLFDRNGRPVFGGKHYIYIMKAKRFALGSGSSAIVFNGPSYDCGVSYLNRITRDNSADFILKKRLVYSQAIWTTMPVLVRGAKLGDPLYSDVIPSQITYKLRVKKPYAKYLKGTAPSLNDSMPYYTFSTEGFAPIMGSDAEGKKALDNIAVVPNPYYAYSSYEDPGNQLDNRIRIVNLPPKCTIRIYTSDGVLVRTIKKDDNSTTYLEWNLKNDAQVPVTSGIYLFHFDAGVLGEKMVKWFGIMRPADYDSF